MHLEELWCNFPPEILSLNQIITIIYMFNCHFDIGFSFTVITNIDSEEF